MNRLHTRLVSPCEKELLASCIQETTPVFLRSREIIERSPFFAIQTVRSARIKARLAPWHVPMSFVFPWPIFLLRSPAESVQWAASRLLRTPARYGLSCAFVHCAAAAMSVGPFSFRRVRSLSWSALHALCSGTLSVAGGSFHSHAGVGTSTQQGLSGPVPDWSVRCESATLDWRRAPVPTCCPRARWWCGRLRVRLAAGRSVCAF